MQPQKFIAWANDIPYMVEVRQLDQHTQLAVELADTDYSEIHNAVPPFWNFPTSFVEEQGDIQEFANNLLANVAPASMFQNHCVMH